MKKAVVIASLIFGSMAVAEAAMQVTNVKRKYISIKDSKKLKLKTGNILAIMDEDGERVGEARVLKVKGKRAQAYLLDGDVEEGYSMRLKTDGDDIDDEMTDSDEDSGAATPFSRGQGIRSSRSRARRAGKTFAIESGLIRDLVGMTNVKAHYRILNSTTVGVGYLRYNMDLDTTTSDGFSTQTSTMNITGNTISVIGTTWFNGTAFSQGAYARAELGRVDLSIETDDFTVLDFEGIELSGDASGFHGHATAGYHWQWANMYTNLYAGIQYVSLSMDAEVQSGGTSDTASASGSDTGFDFGFSMGIAF